MNLAIKVYKPDYGVILKNYLDPKNWEEITIYQYRNFTTSIQLESIDTKNKKLSFKIQTFISGQKYDTQTSYITYMIDHPEYTLSVFESAVKSSIENTFKRCVGLYNYHDTYEMLRSRYYSKWSAIKMAIKNEIQEIYDDLPDLVQKVISFDDLLTDVINEKIDGVEPQPWNYREEHYIQELNVLKGLQTIVEHKEFGVVDFTDDSKLIYALENNDPSELNEEELERYEEIVDVEDINIEDYI